MKDPEEKPKFRSADVAAQERTEAGEPEGEGKKHAPYARMDKDQKESDAPDIGDHSAAGQGLSG